jgi:two-component system, LuxR family, response regulator FixJ
MPHDPVVHVVDDDAAARDSLVFLLQAAELSVQACESGVAFLETVPAADAGCVITDVRMPGITGLELLRRLKARGIAWPVIVMTGQADVPIAIEAIRAGAADFIEKPYDDEILVGSVKAALNRPEERAREAQSAEIRERLAALSRPEHRVLKSLVDGRPHKTMAFDLGISAHAVDIHRASVMTKMQATSLSHLVRMVLLARS